MLTGVLTALCVLLLLALGVVALLRLAALAEIARQARVIRHQQDRIDSYRAELDVLSIAGPPPAAAAALTPDAEPPIPAGWLDDLNTLPTTYDREYPL